jgi:hypothetical protein
MTRCALCCRALILAAVSLTLIAATAFAQLDDTTWIPLAQVTSDGAAESSAGGLFVPIDASSSLPGISSSLIFGPPGPPSATATVTASANSNLITGIAQTNIIFQFRLNQINNPPVPIVAGVPMTVTATGTADITGTLAEYSARADASVNISGSMSASLLSSGATAVFPGGPASSSFGGIMFFSPDPAEVVTGWLRANAELFTETPQTGTASVVAFIDPIFAVSSELIPGTSTRYDEVYAIEFGAGYGALGPPTPVANTKSWGELKQRWGN